jgi:hypothetical protein
MSGCVRPETGHLRCSSQSYRFSGSGQMMIPLAVAKIRLAWISALAAAAGGSAAWPPQRPRLSIRISPGRSYGGGHGVQLTAFLPRWLALSRDVDGLDALDEAWVLFTLR